MAFFCGLCQKIGLRRTIKSAIGKCAIFFPLPALALIFVSLWQQWPVVAPLCHAGDIQVCGWLQHSHRMWNSLPRSALGGQSTALIVNYLYKQEAIGKVTKRWANSSWSLNADHHNGNGRIRLHHESVGFLAMLWPVTNPLKSNDESKAHSESINMHESALALKVRYICSRFVWGHTELCRGRK